MLRKHSCLILAVTLLLCSLAVAHAAGYKNQSDAYDQAASVLNEAGIAPRAATALTNGSGMALAVELGMLHSRSEVLLYEVGAQALQTQQRMTRAAEEATRSQLQRNAYLTLYDGVMANCSLTLYVQPDHNSDALRTLAAGKVAKLLDITDSDWYRVSFANTTGFVRAADCHGVRYADYDGTAATRDLIEDLIAYARTWLGTPYAYGGSSYSGTDCSGFTMRCYESVGFSLSHGARDQYRLATPVSTAQRDVGDLVFFSAPGSDLIEHVGIYLGGGRFIHASTSEGVTIDSVYGPYYADHYYGAARIIWE